MQQKIHFPLLWPPAPFQPQLQFLFLLRIHWDFVTQAWSPLRISLCTYFPLPGLFSPHMTPWPAPSFPPGPYQFIALHIFPHLIFFILLISIGHIIYLLIYFCVICLLEGKPHKVQSCSYLIQYSIPSTDGLDTLDKYFLEIVNAGEDKGMIEGTVITSEGL